jgi:hypothetical protein
MPVLYGVTRALKVQEPPVAIQKEIQPVRQRTGGRGNFVPTPRDFIPFNSMAPTRQEIRDGFYDRSVIE